MDRQQTAPTTGRRPLVIRPRLTLLAVFLGALWLSLLLVACRRQEGVEPLSGSGTLEGRQVAIASELGGQLVALMADEGQVVTAGQVLLRLDDAQAQIQVAQARAALAAAEAALAGLAAGPRTQEVAAAEAQLQLAQAQQAGAAQAVADAQDQLAHPRELDLQISQAHTQVRLAEQKVEGARADLDAEKLRYHIYVELKDDVDGETRRGWDLRLQAAQEAVNAAAGELAAAQADLQALQATRANPLTAQAELHAAQATYTTTLAGVQVAQAALDRLREGPRPQELTIARAQVAQARAALTMTLVKQELLTLTAPISGVVAARSYYTGETVPQGVPILTLADLDTLYLTLYVPEGRIGEVWVGQRATVQVDAYPGELFAGTVERIGTQAEFTPRAIQTADQRARLVFAVRVRLPNPDHRLRPGMPATGHLLP